MIKKDEGMKVLITSGGTKIKIDSVRHIGNMSSGTFGAKIGLEYLKKNHQVIFLKSKGSKSPLVPDLNHHMDHAKLKEVFKTYETLSKKYFDNLTVIEYEDFYDYQMKLDNLLKTMSFDIVMLAAAVSDYGVENPVLGKIRSKADEMVIKLKVLPKLISGVREKAGPRCVVVGFKLLVDSIASELIEAGKESLIKNELDVVIANDLKDIKNDDHSVMFITPTHIGYWKTSSLYDSSVLKNKNQDNILANTIVTNLLSIAAEKGMRFAK